MERDKGHNREVGHLKEGDPLAYFGSVPRFAYVYRKTEKIITALYMVTSLLPDEEPLKWRVRKIGNDILSLTNQLKDKFSTQRDGVVNSIRSLSVEMASLVEVARYSGLMSEMNARVLREELSGLLGLMTEEKDLEALSKSFVLGDAFFNEANVKRGFVYRDSRGSRRTQTDRSSDRMRAIEADRSGQAKGSSRPALPPIDRAAEKDGRRTAVLEVIKSKGTVTIKDVTDIVRNVSEKTIQRELLSLVVEGVLKKEGERRWSRYSLKS